MMNVIAFVSFVCLVILQLSSTSYGQNNIQGLSYSSLDIHAIEQNNPYARPVPTTSTTPTPTTKKSGFFGGIKNFFRGEKKPEVTTPAPTKPTPATPAPTKAAVITPAPTRPSSIAPTPPSSTTAKVTPPAPPLPQRNQPIPAGPPTPPRPTSLPAAVPIRPQSPGAPQVPPRPASVPVSPASPPVPPRPQSLPPGSAWNQGPPPSLVRPQSPTPPPVPPRSPTPSGNRQNFPDLPNRSGGSSPPSVQFVPTTKPKTPSSRPTTSSVTSGPATDAEITTLTEALLTKDVNNPYKYLTVNAQSRTQSSSLTDDAPLPLLSFNESVVFAIPTISKMRELYNNYEIDTTVNEHVTPFERNEENDFLDAIMATSVMRHAMQFLQQKGIVSPDPRTHRDLVKTIWFNLYSRGQGKIGSSAFEHIFLSELKNGTIMGLHNWVYFYDQEKAGKVDYKGYIKKVDIGDKGLLMKLRFTYNTYNKPVNSMFIGTSPELEMAIYTVCFAVRPDANCPVSLGQKTFEMQTHTFRYRGKNLIGSAYAAI